MGEKSPACSDVAVVIEKANDGYAEPRSKQRPTKHPGQEAEQRQNRQRNKKGDHDGHTATTGRRHRM
ncbi:hypothetical protein FQZ97_1212310 [compost metagenome]